jgi:hypothetical protein
MQDGFATLSFQNGKSFEGNLTNGLFQEKEEELDITVGTKHIGSGTENLLTGQGRWIFHENSLFESFEGEVVNGDIKNGTLKAKEIVITDFSKFSGNLPEETLSNLKALVGKNISVAFKITGEWENNKLQGQGLKYLRFGNIETIGEGEFQNGSLKFGHTAVRIKPTNDTTQDLSIGLNLTPGEKL